MKKIRTLFPYEKMVILFQGKPKRRACIISALLTTGFFLIGIFKGMPLGETIEVSLAVGLLILSIQFAGI
jgi:hypothetical protein